MDSPEKRIAEAASITCTDSGVLSYDASTPAGKLFKAALLATQLGLWKEAEEKLDELYRLVGGKRKGTAGALYRGRHPIQRYIIKHVIFEGAE